MSTLLLGYTPPLHRDLCAPWKRPIFSSPDCGQVVDYSIAIEWAHLDNDLRSPGRPHISVSTAKDDDYLHDRYEEKETLIWFEPSRDAFRAAYRLARMIRESDGTGVVTEAETLCFLKVEVGPDHEVFIQRTPFRNEITLLFEQGVCRVCGCVDERACRGGCSWANDERTLCTQCVHEALEYRIARLVA